MTEGRAILVVDDEVLIRFDVAARLRSAGLNVIEAATADEAVLILETVESVALVISDIRMPGGRDGLDLVGWLRRERPDIKMSDPQCSHRRSQSCHRRQEYRGDQVHGCRSTGDRKDTSRPRNDTQILRIEPGQQSV